MGDGDVQVETSFNMAVATLQRIHISLERMRIVFETMPPGLTRQIHHISQVKIFFQNSAPLLKDTIVSSYEKEIDSLKLKSKTIKGRRVNYYSVDLETRLFQIVRNMEIELKPYFMPSKREDDDDY